MWIDVYVNGQLQSIDGQSSTEVLFNDEPNTNHQAGRDTFQTSHTARFSYPEIDVTDSISIPVSAGDFVEVYFYAKIAAEGSTPPNPTGLTTTGKNSNASATVTLKHASMTISS